VTFVLAHFDVGDYDAWKETFDSDPAGSKKAATAHRIFRSVDNPSEVFVDVEFPSVEAAKSFREGLLGSVMLGRITVKAQPTIVELADEAAY